MSYIDRWRPESQQCADRVCEGAATTITGSMLAPERRTYVTIDACHRLLLAGLTPQSDRRCIEKVDKIMALAGEDESSVYFNPALARHARQLINHCDVASAIARDRTNDDAAPVPNETGRAAPGF